MALIWKGTIDSDFFNESNWQDDGTLLPPSAGTINPGVAITTPLSITNTSVSVIANGLVNLGSTSLTIGSAHLSATGLTGTTASVSVNAKGYIDLSSSTPITGISTINFTSTNGVGWVRTPGFSTTSINSILSIFKIVGATATYSSNIRLDNYYLNGCVVRPNSPSTTFPLTIYTGQNLTGTSGTPQLNSVYSGAGIPTGDNSINSFVLAKGYMVTFSTISDGKGKSKTYVASETDLVINVLPVMLRSTISFLRVVPWNWVTKKGTNGTTPYTTINATWRYNWNNDGTTDRVLEYIPMSWGNAGTTPAEITNLIAKYGANHILGFNEPDNVNQSGGFAGLTDPATALTYFDELQKAGIRIISPGCEENGVFTYLKPFNDLARTSNVRFDVVTVHWFDWGGYVGGETGVTATQIFNRFKAHLTKVYNYFGLPIWITEFNANTNRSTALQEGFMTLALPYLETLDYVERYNWFEPTSGNGFLYAGGNPASEITALGTIYKNQVSTPSIPETVVNERNNLNLKF